METKISQSASVGEIVASIAASQNRGKTDVDKMQVSLFDWETRNRMTSIQSILGISEEIGEFVDAVREYRGDLEPIINALGDIAVFSCSLCSKNNLRFHPTINRAPDLAPLLLDDEILHLVSAGGKLCHLALKSEQGIWGYDDPIAVRTDTAILLARLLKSCIRIAATAVDGEFPMVKIFLDAAGQVVQRNRNMIKEDTDVPDR